MFVTSALICLISFLILFLKLPFFHNLSRGVSILFIILKILVLLYFLLFF